VRFITRRFFFHLICFNLSSSHLELMSGLKYCVICSHKGAVAVRQPYIRVVGIEETNETKSRGPAAFTQDEVSGETFMN